MEKKLSETQQRLLLQTAYDDLVRVFPGYSRRWLVEEKKRLFKIIDPKDIMGIDAERARQRSKERTIQSQYEHAIGENEALKQELESVLRMQANLKMRTLAIKSTTPKRHEATFIAMASDWHAEEPVVAANVNHLNEYNLDVFDKRSTKYFENLVKLVKKERAGVDIKNLVLWLGGDFITGNIHEDTSVQNQLGPMDAIFLVQQKLLAGLGYVLNELPGIRITCPTSDGNHSRITKKQMIKSEHENSLEYYMYHNLARYFKSQATDHPIDVVISGSYHTYLDIHGYVCRFHHGHAISYQGGQGGITIPANKIIGRWNRSRPAYLDFFGHFHQRLDGGKFVANGSMIGYNEYALRIGAEFEPAQQQACLIDSLNGKTVVAPILLEEVNPAKEKAA